ncbi:MAG: hypothetical protein LBT17_03620 [Mycoplasmataceae bacterium]|nr:hypothetical protein [Mycoplasmataceae bacterium]
MTQFKDTNELIKYFEKKHFDILNTPLSLEGHKMLEYLERKGCRIL